VKEYGRNYILKTDVEMSVPASNSSSSIATVSTSGGAPKPSNLPSSQTLLQAAKLAIEQDRAIMLDYFSETNAGTAFLGEDSTTNERILVKSKDEFTSLIKKLYKVGEEFIILTENSLYIVSNKIQKRKVNLASLQAAYDS